MAEEEVLEESAAPPKKGGGGGFSVVHLIVIVIVIVCAAAAVIVTTGGKVAGLQEQLGEQINVLKTVVETSSTDEFKLSQIRCTDKNEIVPLSDKPIIVSLADGEHYLSVGLSICLKEGMTADMFALRKDMVLHIVNEYLSRYPRNYYFSGASSEPETDESGDESNMVEELEMESEEGPFVKKKDVVRNELVNEMVRRGADFVEDILITEFLIQ